MGEKNNHRGLIRLLLAGLRRDREGTKGGEVERMKAEGMDSRQDRQDRQDRQGMSARLTPNPISYRCSGLILSSEVARDLVIRLIYSLLWDRF